MKILMVNKFLYPNGGSETYIFKLGEYLKSQGHEVEYFGMEDKRNIVSNSLNLQTSNMDFHTSKLKKIFYPFKIIYSFEAKKKMSKVLKEFKPDIVHLNNFNYQLTPSIIYAVKKYKIPIVQTVHDCQLVCPNHRMYIEHKGEVCDKCLNGKYRECLKNKCVSNSKLKSFIAMVESWYYHKRKTYNLIDCFICPSKYIQKLILRSGIDEEKTKVIYNFVKDNSKNLIKNEDDKYVLYFGRISKEKGIQTLVKVAETMPNIKFVFAGAGPLEKILVENKNSNIEYVGIKKGDDLNELIANAMFTIYPSEWYENCPLSIIESQKLGTPVIGSNLGGIIELINEEETGLIFKANDKEELKQKIEYLNNNEVLLKNMSEKCRNINIYDIDNYYKIIMNEYKKVVED